MQKILDMAEIKHTTMIDKVRRIRAAHIGEQEERRQQEAEAEDKLFESSSPMDAFGSCIAIEVRRQLAVAARDSD